LVRPILMMNKPRLNIVRGDIWLVNFEPTIGDEIQKTRPAVVLSINAAFRYRLQIVAPITSWQEKFASDFWMIKVSPSATNHLDNESTVNTFQIKSLSEERFVRKIGNLSSGQLDDISAAVAICIGYNDKPI
jgi:mRNA interferase MazF